MRISVIIPTLNEEGHIADAISCIRRTSERNETEIIVADARSADRTAELCGSGADIVLELPRKGRAFQMHQGALASSGALLLFLHADTRLPDDWHAVLSRAWSCGGKPTATAFRLKFDSARPFYRFLARSANFRTMWTGVPHGDQAIAVDRQTYFRVGGFPPVPLMEEYALFRKLARLGELKVIPEPVITSIRRYETNGRLFNMIRNTVIIALFYLGVPTGSLARLYQWQRRLSS